MIAVDRAKFYGVGRDAWGPWSERQVEALDLLLNFLEADEGMSDLRWCAYALATTRHETAQTYEPIVERGSRAYFSKYETGTPIGRRLGNTEPGDGWRFRGRGYVQITGRANHERLSPLVGVDLVGDPDSALRPEIAYRIMSVGMRDGLFTGRALGEFVNPERCDYVNARRVVNGLDRAQLIAGYATTFERALTPRAA